MVFQTRYPSWIMFCYLWLLRFAHTGEAQAAKEGKELGGEKKKKKAKFVRTLFISLATWHEPFGLVLGATKRPSAASSPPPVLLGPLLARAGGELGCFEPPSCSPGPSAQRREMWGAGWMEEEGVCPAAAIGGMGPRGRKRSTGCCPGNPGGFRSLPCALDRCWLAGRALHGVGGRPRGAQSPPSESASRCARESRTFLPPRGP